MVDLHNHMLPELDDGARNWDEATAIAKAAKADGISAIVCTPHWVLNRYENDATTIIAKVHQLRQVLKAQRIRLQVHPGAEIHLDPSFLDGIDHSRLLTINDTGRYALLELPMYVNPGTVEPLLDRFLEDGVVPVIAHPERYLWTASHLDKFEAWVRRGMLIQLTAASLLGHFGRDIERLSVEFLRRRWVHVLATDSHGLKLRSPVLSQARDRAAEVVGRRRARRLVSDHPRRIAAGQPLHPGASNPGSIAYDHRRSSSLSRVASSFMAKLKGRNR